MNDLLGGHIQLLSADLPMLEPLVKSGKVRALALFATERSPLLPDLPTSAELGYPGMLMGNWYGMLAPAGLSPDVRATLEKAMLDAMEGPMVSRAHGRGRRRRRGRRQGVSASGSRGTRRTGARS